MGDQNARTVRLFLWSCSGRQKAIEDLFEEMEAGDRVALRFTGLERSAQGYEYLAKDAVLEKIETSPPYSQFKNSEPGRPVRVEMLEPFPVREHWKEFGDYYLVPLWENEKIKAVATVRINTWETAGYAQTTDEFPPKFPPFSLEEASKVAARNLEGYEVQGRKGHGENEGHGLEGTDKPDHR